MSTGSYRPVNPLAVLAGAAALAGLASFVHVGFVAAAVLAFVAGVAALWQIQKSSGTQAGLVIAVLAVVCSVATIGKLGFDYVTRGTIESAALSEVRAQCESFGELLVAGDYEAAYAMTLPAVSGGGVRRAVRIRDRLVPARAGP